MTTASCGQKSGSNGKRTRREEEERLEKCEASADGGACCTTPPNPLPWRCGAQVIEDVFEDVQRL